ncbi:MAG: glutaredoxin family protein [Terriglobia bacterium]
MNPNVKIYTTTWCPDCRRAKQFLKEHGISFQEINIEETEGAEEFVIAANEGKRRVPTFDLSGRTFHCSPYDPQKLGQEFGLESGDGNSGQKF